MPANALDIIASLTLIMNEETARLGAHERGQDIAELAAAKIRLAGLLDAELARLNRVQPDWALHLPEDGRDALSHAVIALGEASTANAAILERQIDLSVELMAAFENEARRASKSRAEVYGINGQLAPIDNATPISVNSEY
ncbi:flagellar biosynthesis protein FlgN [Sphingomonas qilianensis]|uniref:Flagellar biosynthesis protein FlgN n=1 Tax=Sphingomonas qilianensis TaxID=1736690 RepID=A0ABU9XSU8_9SPHN